MRTNIVIDDALISEAMSLTGIKTKREVVDEALRVLVEQKKRAGAMEGLRALQGKVSFWEDILEDLDAHRVDAPESTVTSALVIAEEKTEYNYKPASAQSSPEMTATDAADDTNLNVEREKQ